MRLFRMQPAVAGRPLLARYRSTLFNADRFAVKPPTGWALIPGLPREHVPLWRSLCSLLWNGPGPW